jgi:hypothetical protein
LNFCVEQKSYFAGTLYIKKEEKRRKRDKKKKGKKEKKERKKEQRTKKKKKQILICGIVWMDVVCLGPGPTRKNGRQ